MIERGVVFIDPRQVHVADDVLPERVCAGVVVHPGCRLLGKRTFLGPGAEVGTEGPATLRDTVLGEHARVDAGYLDGAVLFDRARAGWGAHFRAGTLLEEEASTAHVVGLKQTILLSFVTLGSLINFCDCLMAGGTSRRDHSEVGSGFIHFNFTPWGKEGDKATPSLVGDVVSGVFLRQPRIFLGGCGGMVGPGSVGYGSVVGAGQVIRRPVPPETLVLRADPHVEKRIPGDFLDRTEPRLARNLAYVAQLVALKTWYRNVRATRAVTQTARALVVAALENIDLCIEERIRRARSFAAERSTELPPLELSPDHACPLPVDREPDLGHLDWVASLSPTEVEAGRLWLEAVVQDVVQTTKP